MMNAYLPLPHELDMLGHRNTLATYLSGCLQDKTVVVVTSGANMNFDRLRLVSELADIGALREAMLATSIPESPGSFRAFIDTALYDSSQSVTEFKYRCAFGLILCVESLAPSWLQQIPGYAANPRSWMSGRMSGI